MTARAIGGVIGSAVAGIGTKAAQESTPNIGRVGFLAVTADEIALVKTQSGRLKMKVTDEVLTRRPRGEIVSTELAGGMLLSVLTIQFADGGAWAFDVPTAANGSAIQVVHAFGGNVQ